MRVKSVMLASATMMEGNEDLALIVASAFAQSSDVPYDSNGGPTFAIKRVRNCYPGSFSSIQKIDFRNFRFLTFGKDGKPSGGYALKNGHFEHDDEFDHYFK
jgi:hypothetical protein